MIDCSACAQALPITACPTTIKVGELVDTVTVAVRFTDRATGRATVADIDDDQQPTVVTITPFDFAPGQSVMVEVVTLNDDGPGTPVKFYPLIRDTDGTPIPSAYPVTCIVFTPIKSFGSDGALFAAGPRTLIIES